MGLPLIPIWAAVAAIAGTNLGTGIASYFRGRKNGRRQMVRAQAKLEGYPKLLTADVDVLVNQVLSQAAKLAEQERTSQEIDELQKEVRGRLETQKKEVDTQPPAQLSVKAAGAKAEAKAKKKAEEAKKKKKAA